ncbi:hypothetical protein BGZ60DRAFT_418196 [Tricladium varicosporioides]|nr:hypothetical protein BGZ60DRAFT_418196 [Hymenoscyphus varicosporioides]
MAPDITQSGKEKIPTPKHSSFHGRHSIPSTAGDAATENATTTQTESISLAISGGTVVQAQNQPIPQMNISSSDEAGTGMGTGPSTPRPRGIFFTIRNKDHKYDLDRPISAARIREASLSSIFDIVSQHSGIPLKTISRMTLKSIFAKQHVENIVDVLRKDAEEHTWLDVKEKIRWRYEVVIDNDPSQEKFEIRVDVGDIPDIASKDICADDLLW